MTNYQLANSSHIKLRTTGPLTNARFRLVDEYLQPIDLRKLDWSMTILLTSVDE